MQVSRYCLGSMNFGAHGNPDHDECTRIIHMALDAGINFVDTADSYSRGEAEGIIGNALKGRRDDVILTSKVSLPMGSDPNMRGNSRRWIVKSIESSLRRLQTDWIDLYQIHRPDPATAIDETLSALTDLVHQGKVRAIGSSTFPPELNVESHWAAERRGLESFSCEQSPYSIFVRKIERGVLPVCERYGMGVIAYSPLARGWLTGRYRTPEDVAAATGAPKNNFARFDLSVPSNQRKFELVTRLDEVASRYGLALTHFSLAFVLAHPALTSAILGPRSVIQLEDLLAGADVELDDEALDAIDEIVPPGSLLTDSDYGWAPPAITDASLRRRATGDRSAS